MWEAMHGNLRGFYEARTRGPDRRLYRLFCILDQGTAGLDGPTVVVITGLSKPAGTAFTAADYARVRRLGDESISGYRGTSSESLFPAEGSWRRSSTTP